MKLPAYPRTKPSGVEWLGEVPEHWEAKRLKYSASINDEALPETTLPDFEFEYVDIGGVSAVDGITATEQVVFENAPSRARRRVRHGDTIVSTVRTYLRAIAPIKNPPENLIVSTGFAVVRPRKVEPAFLAYALRESSFIESVVARSVGVSYPACNASEVGGIPIPLPDPAEQRAIAAFLDRDTGRVDRLVAKKRGLIERLKERRTALISRTMTRGLPAEAAAKAGLPTNLPLRPSGIEWIGDIPKHWDTPPLYTRYSIELGKMLNEGRIVGHALVPYLRNIDVQWDRINFDDLPEMDIEERERERFTLKEGDLLVCEGGEVGRAAIFKGCAEVTGFQKALHRMRPLNPQEHPRFMFYTLIWASSQGIFLAEGNPNTIPHLTGEKLRRYRFPHPPLTEQAAIAAYLDEETAKLDALVGKVEEAVERLQEYRTALITAAVTGKIDVRKEVAQ